MTALSDPQQVSEETCFCTANAPTLGLEENRAFAHRIYLLKCAPQITGGPFCWYVGISSKDNIRQRLEAHFAGNGSLYTRTRRPITIELVMPAYSESPEAFLFFAMAHTVDLPTLKISAGQKYSIGPQLPRTKNRSRMPLLEDQ